MREIYKQIVIVVILLGSINKSFGRDVVIDWQKCYGGTFAEVGNEILKTFDGGYIFVADSYSKDGDIGGNFSNPVIHDPNAWVVKLDHSGNIEWKRLFDRNKSYDYGNKIYQTRDSGFLMLGCSSDDSSGIYFDVFMVKLDKNGNVIWNKTFLYDWPYQIYGSSIIEEANGNILFASGETYNYFSVLIKLNKSGDIIWEKNYNQTEIVRIVPSDIGFYFLMYNKREIPGNRRVICIDKINSDGDSISGIIIRDSVFHLQGHDIVLSKDKHLAITGEAVFFAAYHGFVMKLDSMGNAQWKTVIPEVRVMDILCNSKNEYFVGYNAYSPLHNNSIDIFLAKFNADGFIISKDSIGGDGSDEIRGMCFGHDGSMMVIGSTTKDNGDITCKKGNTSAWLSKVFFKPKYITGNIFLDVNSNCIQDNNEKGIKNFSIKAYNDKYECYTTSQSQGRYYLIFSDTGLYDVELLPNAQYPYFSPSTCNINFVNVQDSVTSMNLAARAPFYCALNSVNISTTPPFRIGRPNTYNVSYCNKGTAVSFNTNITIKLDDVLVLNYVSVPYTTLPGNTFRFDIGTLDYLNCGSFSFVATPDPTKAVIFQTICAEAHIYPDTICTTPNYLGAFITSGVQCLGDSVRFQLKNTGKGNMAAAQQYRVIENDTLILEQNFQLNINQTFSKTIDAKPGKTYRIIAEQPASLPSQYGDKFTTAALENCERQSNFSTGFFTQSPVHPGTPYLDMTCNEIIGAYDPNDKVATPKGYSTPHYIEANTSIEYQINFQNTGNDTAFKVVLIDTISSKLDINSIQPGASSHTYQFERTDSNVIQFTFDNILLVDSFRNEPGSHGFLKFKIQQKANNPDGTKIYNKADIYFDYNSPITTNETFHTIGRDFISVNLITQVINHNYNIQSVKVFPNPFRDKTQIVLEGEQLKYPVLHLTNLEGQLIKTIQPSGTNAFDIFKGELPPGMYLFKVLEQDQWVANGKLVVQ